MATFKYKTIDQTGTTSEGEIEAKDKFALFHILKKEGVTIISAEEVKKGAAFSLKRILSALNGVPMHDKIVFSRNLSQMIEAGLPITRALSIMEKQAKKTSGMKKVLTGLNDSLSKGTPLSDAMKEYPGVFSPLFISMVKAGEESGNLAMALKNVAAQMEKTYQLNKKIRGALMYPSVIFCLMIVIGALMMVYMVPTLTRTFVGLGVQLPLSTRIIIGISDFLKNYFALVFLGTIGAIVAIYIGFKTKRGQRMLDFSLLHTPMISEMVKQTNSARTARTLSSLLSAGVDIVLAVGVTKDVLQNSYYKDVMQKIESVIQKGDQISSIFLENEKLFPLFVGEMVAVGEETGKIGEMLSGVAQFYEEEVDQKTKDLSSIIEPVLMIVIGVAVGVFAISMLAPTYSLADSL